MKELFSMPAAEMKVLMNEISTSGYLNMTNEQVMNTLSSPVQVPNPVTVAPKIPKKYYAADVMGVLSSGSLKNFMSLPPSTAVVDTLNQSDVIHTMQWAQAALAIGTIATSEYVAIQNLVQQTIPDPAWTSTVPGPRRLEQMYGTGRQWLLITLNDNNAILHKSYVNYVPLSAIQTAKDYLSNNIQPSDPPAPATLAITNGQFTVN